MRSPSTAIVWEIWAAHRRSWLLVLAVIPIWAVMCQVFSDNFNLQHSELIKGLSFIPAMLTTSLVMSIFNFTEVNHRKGFAGFPQRLFTAPMPTWSLVAIPMACGVAGVVLLYFAWAVCVFRPAGVDLMIRWPAILLAVAVVFYQSIIWCLSGFRITRLIVLGIVMTCLVGVGFIPFMPTKLREDWTEVRLTIILAILSVGAFAASVVVVGSQRRGGGQGWAWRRELARRLSDAIPHVQWNLKTPDRALLWMEWRLSGLVLPAAVLFALLLIMGPASWIAGYGPKATGMAVAWISVLPILLAVPIGQGIAKPDFWSLELSLPPFLTTRPISGAQIVAAKMKSAAISTLLTWGLVLLISPVWLYLNCDLEFLRDTRGMLRTVYAPFSQWAIPALFIVAAMLLTWSLLVGGIWRGYSGRTWFFYTLVGLNISAFIASWTFFAWLFDTGEDHGSPFVDVLPWLPWILAACFIAKSWSALAVMNVATRYKLISSSSIKKYFCVWVAGASVLIALAWFISPAVEWMRDILILVALLMMPVTRFAAAPLAVAWNRHR